jgi:drug/metabolite transporter (DMT)-like permease
MPADAARLRDLAVVVLVPLFFSTNVVIGKAVAADAGPWTLALLRWTGAFLILLPFALAGLRASCKELFANAPLILLLGFLGMWVCGGGVYMALHATTATNATLIYCASNVMILVLEWLFRGRPIGVREALGTLLAFAGVAVVTVGAEGGTRRINSGDALIALAAFAWAVYSVLLKRRGLTAIPGLALFAAIMLAGSVLLLPMAGWEIASGPALPHTAGAWLAVAGVALIPSVGAFSGYQYGIRRFGPGTMAMTSYLWTPWGVLLALIFLGETLHAYHIVGFALIVPGVVLATARWTPRRRHQEEAAQARKTAGAASDQASR